MVLLQRIQINFEPGFQLQELLKYNAGLISFNCNHFSQGFNNKSISSKCTTETGHSFEDHTIQQVCISTYWQHMHFKFHGQQYLLTSTQNIVSTVIHFVVSWKIHNQQFKVFQFNLLSHYRKEKELISCILRDTTTGFHFSSSSSQNLNYTTIFTNSMACPVGHLMIIFSPLGHVWQA